MILRHAFRNKNFKHFPATWQCFNFIIILCMSSIMSCSVLQKGWSPLMSASQQGNVYIVECLVNKGADPNASALVSIDLYVLTEI